MPRWMSPTACLVALACLPAAGCERVHAGPAAGAFIYAKAGDAVTLDPGDLADLESATVAASIYDGLVRFAPEGGTVRPALADRWQASTDGKTWSFHLRPGVRFHDGTACDAAAVKLNFDRPRDPAHPLRFGARFGYWAQLFGHVRGVAAPDAATVVFTLARPDPRFLANLATYANGIGSPAALRRYQADIGRHPVGTGPFKFTGWTPNEKIVLEANPDYWGGASRVQRLIFQVIPDNTVRLMALAAGRVHAIEGINADDVARIQANPALRLLTAPGLNVGYLAFNTARGPTRDPRVRRAVAHAFDRRRLLQAFFARGRVAEAPANLLPPAAWSYDRQATSLPYDPAAARRLLAEAGFPGGLSLSLWAPPIARPYLPDGQKVAQAIQAELAQVGVRVRVVSYEWGTFLAKTSRGEHDLLLSGWTSETGDPDDFLYTLLHSRNATPGKATNKAFFRYPRLDRLLDRAQAEMDPARRAALYREAQAIARRELPYLPMFTARQMVAVRRDVQGFQLYATGRKDFSRVELLAR